MLPLWGHGRQWRKKKNQVLVVTFKSSFPETVEVYYQHGEEIRMKAIMTFIIKNTTFLSF